LKDKERIVLMRESAI